LTGNSVKEWAFDAGNSVKEWTFDGINEYF